MIKKFVMFLGLAALIALPSVQSASAQPPAAAFPPQALEMFKKEPPLAQKDIDAYIIVLPKVVDALNDPAAGAEVFADSGFTPIRFSYVSSKIGIGQGLAMGASPDDMQLGDIPEVLRPSEAEISLIKKNLDSLTKVAMDARGKMGQ